MWLAFLVQIAAADPRAGEDPAVEDWWVGLPVHSVQIVSPGGGTPEESLDPLLRVRQGEPLDPASVRLDLTTLFHAGEFAAVQAVAEPWVVQLDSGELQPAVILRYNVHAAPRAGRVRLQGIDTMSRRDVLAAAGIDVGEAFYPEVDGPRVERAILAWYRKHGFDDATVEVDPYPLDERGGVPRLEIWIRVSEGDPPLLQRLTFSGDIPVSERRLRRAARRALVRPGAPLSAEAVTQAQYAIREDLAAPDRWFGLIRGGYVESRVTPAITGNTERGLELVYHVEGGARLVLDVKGVWPWPDQKVRRALSIDERLRLTRGFVEEAPERLETWMQRRGYLDAAAEVELVEAAEIQTLMVRVRRGSRHHLSPVLGRRQRIRFEGNVAVSDAQLRAVMVQASEEVLRLGFVTRPEIDLALEAAEELYRAQGYQDVALSLAAFAQRPRPAVWRLPGFRAIGRAMGIDPPTDVTLKVAVTEGALTRLDQLRVDGTAADVDLGWLEARRVALEGGPYSPQGLELLARAIVEAHRNAGYLETDARVVVDRHAPEHVSATIAVQTGPRVLLRSFVVTGAQKTRIPFIRRQVDLVLGQPVTARGLEDVRRGLYDLGVFRTVSTELIGDAATRDVIIAVEERPRWGFELGGGLSTDQGLRGFGRITRNNVWGLAHRWDLYAQAGLDYRSDSIADWWFDVANPEWRAAATYSAPRFPGRSQQLVIDFLAREEVQERTWRLARSGVGVSVETRVSGRTTLRTGVRLDARQLQEVDVGAILPGEPWDALLHGTLTVPTPWREQQLASVLLVHDRRDNPLKPSRGVLMSIVGEASPGFEALGGELQSLPFVKGDARISAYAPIGGAVLHISGEAAGGRVLGDGVLAVEDRYRLGGTGSMRGFRRDAVGPRNEVSQIDLAWPDGLEPVIEQSVRTDPTRWVSTGGDSRALVTAELLLPLPILGLPAYEGYAAAVYADIGNVWLLGATSTSEFPQYDEVFDPVLRYGFGVGLRVDTPVGPLQLDVATNPEAALATGARRDLLRDQWEEPALRGHLSLGTLF